MSVIDVGAEVREGEELDIGAVENWLKNQGVEFVGPAIVTQYTGAIIPTVMPAIRSLSRRLSLYGSSMQEDLNATPILNRGNP